MYAVIITTVAIGDSDSAGSAVDPVELVKGFDTNAEAEAFAQDWCDKAVNDIEDGLEGAVYGPNATKGGWTGYIEATYSATFVRIVNLNR